MAESREQFAVDVLSGAARGVGPTILRMVAKVAEPFYATAMHLRNAMYDRGIFRSHLLGRPTISIGNLTTGGTGKTPVVRWLAEKLSERGRHPAILMRGYRGEITGGSDEQRMLQEQLGLRATVIANPDRVAAAAEALAAETKPDVFILDDGFQHRRAKRNFDLVLLDAADPFGFGHVLPRGFMREPAWGLRRAHAILLTRCTANAEEVEAEIRRYSAAPIYQCWHEVVALVHDQNHAVEALGSTRHFLFCGIGQPRSFFMQFHEFGAMRAGTRAFADHHAYTESDVRSLNEAAAAAGAEILISTEKDWVKLRSLPNVNQGLPIWRAQLEIRFRGDDEQRLLKQMLGSISESSPTPVV